VGGEEFAVFLPGVNQNQTRLIAERIRSAVNMAVFTPDGEQRSLSVSIGGAVFDNRTTFAELFRLADQRLYGAKNAGRNMSTIGLVTDHPLIHLKRSA
jgi:diguanylate cyclase